MRTGSIAILLQVALTSVSWAGTVQVALPEDLDQGGTEPQGTAPNRQATQVTPPTARAIENLDPNQTQRQDKFVLDMPCEKRPTPEEMASGVRKSCLVGLRYCDEVLPEIKKMISKVDNFNYARGLASLGSPTKENSGYIDAKIWGFYHGVNVDLFRSDKDKFAGRTFPIPSCNPTDGEVGVNSFGTPCGANGKGTENGLEVGGPQGMLEDANIRGAYIQALKCYKTQVLNEVARGKLNVTGFENVPVATDISATYTNAQQWSQFVKDAVFNDETVHNPALVKNFCRQDDLQFNKKVKVNDLCKSETSTDFDADIAKHRISSCKVDAIANRVQAQAAYLASAEVFSRADRAFKHLFTDLGKNADYKRFMKENVIKPCARQAQSCKSKIPVCGTGCAKQCGIDKFNSCYKQDYQRGIMAYITARFPNNGFCSGDIRGAIYDLITPGSSASGAEETTSHIPSMEDSLWDS